MKPIREHLHGWLYGLSPLVAIFTETLIPSALLFWVKRLWFSEASIELTEKILWAVLSLAWLIWYLVYKKRTGKGQWWLDLRQVLIQGRGITVSQTYRLQKLLSDTLTTAQNVQMLDTLEELLDFERTRKDILLRLFHIFSHGNINLDQHVRVTLFEPENEELNVKDWANSEDEPPRCMALGLTFKKGEGTAGWAWQLMKPFILSDLDSLRKQNHLLEKGKRKRYLGLFGQLKVDPTWFIELHPEQEKVKSIVCIPVIQREPGVEKLRCVISIDSDVKYMFRETEKGEHDIRIMSYPLTRAIALAYEIKDVLQHLRNTQTQQTKLTTTP